MKQTSVFRQLLSLSRDSVIYGISVVISQFVGFTLIPVYTKVLKDTGYGAVEILNTTETVLGLILAMGFTTALLRFYSSREDEESKRTVASTAVVFLAATSLVVLLALELAAGPISSLIFRSSGTFTSAEYTRFFRLIFLSTFFNGGIGIALTVFRARGEPTKYAITSVVQFVMAVSLNLLFVIGLHKGVVGVMYAELITTASLYVVLMTSLVRRVGIRLSRHELKAMLNYGLPLVPTGIGSWMLVMADRWLLARLVWKTAPGGLVNGALQDWVIGQVGVYSLGYKFGMVIQGVLVGPIQLAWLPFLFATAKQDKARETYTRVFTYFLLAALLIALAISALAKELIAVMADPSFYEAYKVIPLVALSYVLYGCYYQLAAGMYLEGKTNHMAVLMGVAAVLNVALNFALIPHYGIMGSAVATLVAYALLPVGAYVISQRYYHVDYEWGRVSKMVLVVAVIYAASVFVGSAVHSLLISGGVKVLLLLTYPVLLYAVGFFRHEEIDLVRQFVRSALAWVGRRLGRKPSSPDGPGNVGR